MKALIVASLVSAAAGTWATALLDEERHKGAIRLIRFLTSLFLLSALFSPLFSFASKGEMPSVFSVSFEEATQEEAERIQKEALQRSLEEMARHASLAFPGAVFTLKGIGETALCEIEVSGEKSEAVAEFLQKEYGIPCRGERNEKRKMAES